MPQESTQSTAAGAAPPGGPAASILHVDMDSFFVSVELLDHPHLRGRPVAISSDSPRAVVASASYEARRFGVSSAMSTLRAKQLCPQLQLIAPRHDQYRAYSRRVFAILERFTPLVEPLSIDEAFLDVSGATKLFGTPEEISRAIRTALRTELGLPASVGVAATKFLAKIASTRAKPDGILVIAPEQTAAFLADLPIGALWGVGAVTETKLRSRAIHTVGDLRQLPLQNLQQLVGVAAGAKLYDLARGRDPRQVTTERTEKSVSVEHTFEFDQTDRAVLREKLTEISYRVARRLRRHELYAHTVTLKLREANFNTITRSHTLSEATDSSTAIANTVLQLLERADPGTPIRLLGVGLTKLETKSSATPPLWDFSADDTRDSAARRNLDAISDSFAPGTLLPARLLSRKQQD